MIKRIILFILFISIFSTSISFAKTFYTITIDGAITHFTYRYIEKSIKIAEENKGILLIKLDTPGGLLDATRDIVQLILESESPIVTYVYPQGARAGSAGTFIVLASHVAAMAEGTNIGAAHPVNLTGKDIEGDMKEKIIQDTLAFISAIAEKRGRNEEIAKKMVAESLSLKSSEALKKGIVDYVTNNIGDLAKFVNKKYNYGKEYELKPIKTTSLEKIAFFLSDPNIIVLLLLAGILAIFLEIKMPGTFIFAALGITCIILFLIGISIIPINYLALLLILAGIALVIAEVFVPSFGLLTLSAIIALASGL
ncbi:MAG: ATP-dependent Clp protease proteolytic subunit, partial [Deferribacterota bacterium]|nr:ATP-dependent Clp protease proteolytic subunit [Deferribacterota bacterium]